MDSIEFFRRLVAEQKRGIPAAVCSVCSSHPLVLRAAMADAEEADTFVLVESTVNQVNQDGGYTGMTPAQFRRFIDKLAVEAGFPQDRILLGADHAGPTAWKDQPAEVAMEKARVLTADLIRSGYSKIHLDASIPLPGDRVDPVRGVDPVLVAEREASMAAAAEGAFSAERAVTPPVYVIGTDVPPPGGMKTDEEELPVTSAGEFAETVSACEAAFGRQKLNAAWQRVFAVVVNLGAEFGDQIVHPYDRVKTKPVCDAARENAQLILEGHSTDYQEPASLRQMVEDGVAVLKVGPALTFAMRESLFALECIEKELVPAKAGKRSDLRNTLDRAMLENRVHWQSYCSADDNAGRLFRSYSWYDRCRYYWNLPAVNAAVHGLMESLRHKTVPPTLLSQFCPAAFRMLRSGQLVWEPEAVVLDRIREVLKTYREAGNGAAMNVEADE